MVSIAQTRRRSFPAPALPEAIIAQGRSAIALRWVLSRALALSMLAFFHESDVTGDVQYYGRSLHQLFAGGNLHDTLQEYPLPVLALMLPQFLLAFLNQAAFILLFAVSMLAVDAVFTGFLWRGDGRQRGDATNVWLWFVPAIGPLAYFRFDLVPAMLAGGAVLAAIRRPRMAGVLTAIGAGLKLWPAVMLPTFLIRRADRKPVAIGFFGTGLVLAVLSLVIGGVDRLLTPLSWQSARGLQIESVTGTPLMAARLLDDHKWTLAISRYKAWEIFGPGVSVLVKVSTVATVLGGILLITLWWRAHKLAAPSAETLGWVFLSTALVVTVTNKTLSPQYLLWLGGPIAALAVRAPGSPAVRKFARVLLITAIATQLVYPIGYQQITDKTAQMPIWTTVLIVRNCLLLYLTWLAVRQVWIRTGPQARRPEAQLTQSKLGLAGLPEPVGDDGPQDVAQ